MGTARARRPPPQDINELFDSWDKDGGGSLDFRELQKILKAPPPKEKVQKATNKLKAVAALTGGKMSPTKDLLAAAKAGASEPIAEE